jgi:hypothetical protein
MINDSLVSNHAYGSLIRPRVDSNVTFHHNLYAHNSSRQARFGTYNAETLTTDFRNNVVYNFRDRASYAGGSSESEQEFVDVNYVGNYIIAGPGTTGNPNIAFSVDKNVDVRAYQSGNFVDADGQLNPGGQPNGADTGWGMFTLGTVTDQTLTQMGTPFATPPVTTQTAGDAFQQIINHVGNHWGSRDAIDTRVINNVLNTTNAPGGIGASAPPAAELNGVLTAPQINRPAGWDSDNDGMPNAWETAHGLNPNSPGANPDWKLDFDNDGYINLIEYVNEIGEFPAPAPIVFNGATNNRYALITNWNTNDGGITAGSNWQPSKYDEAQINNGTVVIDSIGQHAGLLVLGANPGNNATLNITNGWLKAAGAVVIGGDDAATATLSLSGGILSTPALAKGQNGTLNFSGGVLQTSAIGFSLNNQGGTFDPGQSVADTHVMGDLTLTSGSLKIELASESLADKLIVDGDVSLGGSLSVLALPGFTPELGDSWQIIDGASLGGAFSSITAGYSVQQQGDDLMLYFGDAPSPVLAGDYNDDGIVDAGDYVVWSKAMAGGAELANETASPGIVDYLDYDEWLANFGSTEPGSGGAGESNVPEPSAWKLLILAAGLAPFGRPRHLRVFGRFLQE